jgi:hypothetical protein
MNVNRLTIIAAMVLSVSQVAVAGPAVLTEALAQKVIEKTGDTATAMTNSITGGVTSQEGKIKAKGVVSGSVTNKADGEGAESRVNIGGNTRTTAKGDIESDGFVGRDVVTTANGANATATTLVGGNGL